MVQRNCKNCNAPIQHSYNHRCEYCGTLFDFNEPKEETIEFNSRDMIDVRFISCDERIETNSIILTFEGTLSEKPKIYENNKDNMYVSKVIPNMPKRSHFCIAISENELYHYGESYLYYIIREHINFFEYEKVFRQLKNNPRIFYALGRIGKYE